MPRIAPIFLSLFLLSCGTKQLDPDDIYYWEEDEIRGNVETITTIKYGMDNEPEWFEVNSYNTSRMLTETISYNRDSTVESINRFTYDSQNLVIQEDYIRYSNHHKLRRADTAITLNTHNDAGLMVRSEQYVKGKLVRWWDNQYNDNRKPTLKTYENDDNIKQETTYKYDKNGRLIQRENEEYVLTLARDSNGRTTHCKTYTKTGDEYNSLRFTEDYEYDSRSRVVKIKSIEYDWDKPTSSWFDILCYDDNNRSTEWISINSNGYLNSYQAKVFDKNGNMVESKQLYSHDYYTEIVRYTYDEQGSWILAVHNLNDGCFNIKRKIKYYE